IRVIGGHEAPAASLGAALHVWAVGDSIIKYGGHTGCTIAADAGMGTRQRPRGFQGRCRTKPDEDAQVSPNRTPPITCRPLASLSKKRLKRTSAKKPTLLPERWKFAPAPALMPKSVSSNPSRLRPPSTYGWMLLED